MRAPSERSRTTWPCASSTCDARRPGVPSPVPSSQFPVPSQRPTLSCWQLATGNWQLATSSAATATCRRSSGWAASRSSCGALRCASTGRIRCSASRPVRTRSALLEGRPRGRYIDRGWTAADEGPGEVPSIANDEDSLGNRGGPHRMDKPTSRDDETRGHDAPGGDRAGLGAAIGPVDATTEIVPGSAVDDEPGATVRPRRRRGWRPRGRSLGDRSPPGDDGRRHPGPGGPADRGGYPRLRDPGRAGPRRHGRRLQGPAGPAEPPVRPEDDPGRRPCQRAGRRAVPGRGGGGRPAPAPQHRADPRDRRGRRAAVLRAGVRGRRQPGPSARRHALAVARRRAAGRALARGIAEAHRAGRSSTAT